MDFNRRLLLKALVAVPFTRPIVWTQQAKPMAMQTSGSPPLDIFLHGFFLTEVQGNNLVIASPEYGDHVFGYWDHTDNLLHDPPPATSTPPYPWIAALATTGRANQFKDEILQFGRADVGSGTHYFIPPPDFHHRYGWYLKLPLPADIQGVRRGGNIKEMVMRKHSKVAGSVYGHCGYDKQLKLITRLRYNTVSPVKITSINLYAEHCSEPQVGNLNDLFAQTAKLLPLFDLRLKKLKDEGTAECAMSDDEKALCELGSTLTNNPCTVPCECPSQKLIRTANCPQFGIV